MESHCTHDLSVKAYFPHQSVPFYSLILKDFIIVRLKVLL